MVEFEKEAAAEIDKLKQVAKQLYYACLSSTGAYDALETIGAHKELPGYEACLQELKDAIWAYNHRDMKSKTLVLCPLKETKVYRWVCLEECTWYRDNKCPLMTEKANRHLTDRTSKGTSHDKKKPIL